MCGTLITKTINGVHYKESKQAGICQSFTYHKLLMRNSLKFPLPNIHAIWYCNRTGGSDGYPRQALDVRLSWNIATTVSSEMVDFVSTNNVPLL